MIHQWLDTVGIVSQPAVLERKSVENVMPMKSLLEQMLQVIKCQKLADALHARHQLSLNSLCSPTNLEGNSMLTDCHFSNSIDCIVVHSGILCVCGAGGA